MSAAELVGRCFHARTEAHIFHLQTRSFAAHKALNEFYDEIVELTDSFAEAYQGRFGIITGYPETYESCADEMEMLTDLRDWIDKNRKAISERSELQNLIDEIVSLIDGTMYKLKFLK